MLKKLFPLAFRRKKTIAALIINVLIHLIVDAVVGVAIGLLVKLPLVGGIIGTLGGLVGLYFTVSMVLSVLHYLKIVRK